MEINHITKGCLLKAQLLCIPKQLIMTPDYDSDKAKQLKLLLEQRIDQLK